MVVRWKNNEGRGEGVGRAGGRVGTRKGTGKSLFLPKFCKGTSPLPTPPKNAQKSIWREKTDKEKSHKGIWRSDAPEASQGQIRDVPGTSGTFGPDLCVNQC